MAVQETLLLASTTGLPLCEAKQSVGEADQPGMEAAAEIGWLAAAIATPPPPATNTRLAARRGFGALTRRSFLPAEEGREEGGGETGFSHLQLQVDGGHALVTVQLDAAPPPLLERRGRRSQSRREKKD